MGWLFSIFLIVVGALAAYSQVVQMLPQARQLLDKLQPYQGIIGVVALAGGVLMTLHLLANLGMMMRFAPVIWLASLAGSVLCALLGLLLGYGLVAQHVLSRSGDLQRRGETFRAKLAARQTSLGLGAMGVGAVVFLMFLVR
jgi:hypothetical protein